MRSRQVIIGIVFGILACLATQYGIPYEGYVLNVRSASPLTAGLVFGGPAGIIAGVMGAAYRWFSVYWGIPSYTRVACTLATLMAGLIGTFCRRYMFENKRTSWFYGIFIAIATEVFHMLLVFLTHMEDIRTAFSIVRETTIPMVVANSISLFMTLFFATLVAKERIHKNRSSRPITQTFSVNLFACVLISFLVTCNFTYYLQHNVSDMEVEHLLTMNVSDVKADIEAATERSKNDIAEDDTPDVLSYAATYRHIGQNGFMFIISQENGKVISAPADSVTEENISLFSQGLSDRPDDWVMVYQTTDGREYCYLKSSVEDYVVVGCIPKEEAEFSSDLSVYISAYMLMLVFFVLFILVFFLLKHTIVRNIHTINASLARITGGDLSTQVHVQESEEFVSLSNDINTTVARLKDLISEAEKRIDIELAFAKTIQHSVLPSVFPAFPEQDAFDIYASMDSAKEVGGDFYDFYMLDRNRLVFLIADVSGKGIPAAMFMMNAKSIIKSLAESGLSVEEIFTAANRELCENNEAGMFVTAWMGILDLSTGVVRFANAGHNPPLVGHQDDTYSYLKSRPGFVLAGMEGIRYRSGELTLEPGDVVFLYTDGVTEATNAHEELFGEDRLVETLNKVPTRNVEEICRAVRASVDDFVGEAPQFDDITTVVMQYKGAADRSVKKTFRAAMASIESATEFVEDALKEYDVPFKTMTQINIAIDEILSNVVRYAYPDGTGDVSVSVLAEDGMVTLTFTDNGVAFNPLEHNDPNVVQQVEDRPIGGLGIFMVRKIMDGVQYEYANGQNILTICKRI